MKSRMLDVLVVVAVVFVACTFAQQAALIVHKAVLVPPHVNIAGMMYTVIMGGTSPEDNGSVDPDRTEIRLDPKVSEERMKEVMMHEAMHACVYNAVRVQPQFHSVRADYDPDRTHWLDHTLIEIESPCMIQIIRDNPELVKWWQKREGEVKK